MDQPEDIKQKLRHLEAVLDDLIWEGRPYYELKKVKEEIAMLKLKLEMGETHDRSF